MYLTVIGLLPLFLFIVIVGNSFVANQVDSGSMAYVLSTPTKRSAVANAQAIFLTASPLLICTVVCIARIGALSHPCSVCSVQYMLIGLYDIKTISTVDTDSVDYSFVWKLCVLAGIAIETYLIGKFRFQKKDLPL